MGCNGQIYGTSNRSIDGLCLEPYFTPHYSCYGGYWRLEGRIIEDHDCRYVEDPPLPEDPGAGGGGFTNLPCSGDIFKNPKIAASNATNINGGRFGPTRTRKDGTKKNHWGLDIYSEVDLPLYPLQLGKVVSVVNNVPPNERGTSTDFGNHVIIETEYYFTKDKVRILYAHLNRVDVKVNDIVEWETQLGLTGRTGNAAEVLNPHVHIQVYKNGVKVNPEPYMATKFDAAGAPINKPCN